MDEHDKGIALPDETPSGDDISKEHWSRTVRALDSLRRSGGQTAREVAKYIREPLSHTEVALKKLLVRREVQTEKSEEGETIWSIPRKQLKAHQDLLRKQSKVAASFFNDWTCLAIAARLKAGIEIYGSYPYVLVQAESDSSTTTPLT